MKKNMRKPLIVLGTVFFSMSILVGCVTQENLSETQMVESQTELAEIVRDESVALDEGITIEASSKRISNKLANETFADIKEQIIISNEGINTCENFSLVISSEKIKQDGIIWERLWIYYDLIPMREAKDHPFIIGMEEAKAGLSDAEEIAIAEEEIEGCYKEFEGNLNQQAEEPTMFQQMNLAYDPDGEDYTIYCESKPDGEYELVTLEEYFQQHTEDYEAEKQKGIEHLMEAVTFNESVNKN